MKKLVLAVFFIVAASPLSAALLGGTPTSWLVSSLFLVVGLRIITAGQIASEPFMSGRPEDERKQVAKLAAKLKTMSAEGWVIGDFILRKLGVKTS